MSTVFSHYLSILGCEGRAPSRSALNELVAAHLTRVKFENISKLYYFTRDGSKGIPALEQYLDGIESFGFGGTCYSNNYYVHRLLGHLGYDVTLCGADMSQPDVHVVNLVRLDGREFLVDVGYAAPFIGPIPRDLDDDYEVVLGNDRYMLAPREADGRSVLRMYRDGKIKHGYSINPTPRDIDHFTDVIADSFRDDATFLNALLIARFTPGSAMRLHNYKLTEFEGTSQSTITLDGRDALIDTIGRRFGIDQRIAATVLEWLGDLDGDPWS